MKPELSRALALAVNLWGIFPPERMMWLRGELMVETLDALPFEAVSMLDALASRLPVSPAKVIRDALPKMTE